MIIYNVDARLDIEEPLFLLVDCDGVRVFLHSDPLTEFFLCHTEPQFLARLYKVKFDGSIMSKSAVDEYDIPIGSLLMILPESGELLLHNRHTDTMVGIVGEGLEQFQDTGMEFSQFVRPDKSFLCMRFSEFDNIINNKFRIVKKNSAGINSVHSGSSILDELSKVILESATEEADMQELKLDTTE